MADKEEKDPISSLIDTVIQMTVEHKVKEWIKKILEDQKGKQGKPEKANSSEPSADPSEAQASEPAQSGSSAEEFSQMKLDPLSNTATSAESLATVSGAPVEAGLATGGSAGAGTAATGLTSGAASGAGASAAAATSGAASSVAAAAPALAAMT